MNESGAGFYDRCAISDKPIADPEGLINGVFPIHLICQGFGCTTFCKAVSRTEGQPLRSVQDCKHFIQGTQSLTVK